MNENKKYLNIVIGLSFIIFGTLAMDYSIYQREPSWALWLCYIGLILIGLGIIFKSPKLIISQLYILTIPLLIWLTDFSFTLITGQKLLGITNYFFDPSLLLIARIIALEHFFLLPIAYGVLYFIYNQEKIKYAWIISLTQISMVYLAVKFLTDDTQNVNCIFRSCWSDAPASSIYPGLWFLIVIAIIFLTKFGLDLMVYLKSKSN